MSLMLGTTRNKLVELSIIIKLKEYVLTKQKACLEGTPFKHIVRYMSDNPDEFRKDDLFYFSLGYNKEQLENHLNHLLKHACDIFDYEISELDTWKSIGCDDMVIAIEICNRYKN